MSDIEQNGEEPRASPYAIRRFEKGHPARGSLVVACIVAVVISLLSVTSAVPTLARLLPGGPNQDYQLGYLLGGAIGSLLMSLFFLPMLVWAATFYIFCRKVYRSRLGRYFLVIFGCCLLVNILVVGAYKYSPATMRSDKLAREMQVAEQALKANLDDYISELNALNLDEALSFVALAKPNGIGDARETIQKAQTVVEDHQQRRDELAAPFEDMVDAQQPLHRDPAFWERQSVILITMEGRIGILSRARGRWHVQDGKLYFSDTAALKNFERNSEALRQLSFEARALGIEL